MKLSSYKVANIVMILTSIIAIAAVLLLPLALSSKQAPAQQEIETLRFQIQYLEKELSNKEG